MQSIMHIKLLGRECSENFDLKRSHLHVTYMLVVSNPSSIAGQVSLIISCLYITMHVRGMHTRHL